MGCNKDEWTGKIKDKSKEDEREEEKNRSKE